MTSIFQSTLNRPHFSSVSDLCRFYLILIRVNTEGANQCEMSLDGYRTEQSDICLSEKVDSGPILIFLYVLNICPCVLVFVCVWHDYHKLTIKDGFVGINNCREMIIWTEKTLRFKSMSNIYSG